MIVVHNILISLVFDRRTAPSIMCFVKQTVLPGLVIGIKFMQVVVHGDHSVFLLRRRCFFDACPQGYDFVIHLNQLVQLVQFLFLLRGGQRGVEFKCFLLGILPGVCRCRTTACPF